MADKANKVGISKYLGQVRQEGRKVVWPSWNETMVTTVLVLVFMIILAAFFWVVDGITSNGVRFLLNIGTTKGTGG